MRSPLHGFTPTRSSWDGLGPDHRVASRRRLPNQGSTAG
jgi:hypothetical protein